MATSSKGIFDVDAFLVTVSEGISVINSSKRAGSGCLNSAPRKLSGFLPGYAERGALRF